MNGIIAAFPFRVSTVSPASPLPLSDETERLAALRRLQIIGTPRAPDFDAVLDLALQICGCSAGVIGLMDADRHWFKAEIGLGVDDVPRHVSLGNHTLLQSDPLIVEDLTRDARFAGSAAATDYGVRFYAGIALRAEGGRRVGTLCLSDKKAHAPSADLAATLQKLAHVIEGLLAAHERAVSLAALADRAATHEQELWKKTRRLEQTERLARIGTWELDVASSHVDFSDEAYRIHEIDPAAKVDLGEIRSRWPRADQERSAILFKKILEDGQGYDYISETITARGTRRWMHSIVDAEQRDGQVVRLFGTIRDTTTEHLAEETLWRAAHYDMLTGAPNRQHWTTRLDEAFARAIAERGSLTIMMIDLDGFKEINDTRGHAAGDTVLLAVAQRLGESLPDGAFHARLGGDEFAVLIEGCLPAGGIETIARSLLAAIAQPVTVETSTLRVSGTVGGASFPADAATASDLMQRADIALYQAKRSHRSSFVPFRPEIANLFNDKRDAIDLVATAIAEQRLVPFYQPKVDLTTGRVSGFEALCRIEAADGTILGPAQFQPALDDPASAARIGTAMIERVTADIAAWLAEGLTPGRVAINVAGSDFLNGALDRRILDRLTELALPPTALEIEVTENTILGREAMMVGEALRVLRDQGITIAFDDFGTGFASLTHLRDAPIACIKLDRSFIAGIGQDTESAIILKSIVDLGHDLGLRIVAEGIETGAQAAFLRSIGCDEAQGFLFGRPASQAATRASLQGRARSDQDNAPRIAGEITLIGAMGKAAPARQPRRRRPSV